MSPTGQHSPTIVPDDRRALLTVNGAAKYLAVSRWQVYALVRRGDLHPLHAGQRLRFRVEELDRHLEREAP